MDQHLLDVSKAVSKITHIKIQDSEVLNCDERNTEAKHDRIEVQNKA